MAQLSTKSIFACEELVDYWFDGGLLAILEGDQAQTTMAITLLGQQDWRPLSRTSLEDHHMPLGRKPWDGSVAGQIVRLVWEANTDNALVSMVVSRRHFTEGALETLSTEPDYPLALSEVQAEAVNMTAPPWNSFLPPERHLFNPSFVAGSHALVIANTADNQAMLFRLDPEAMLALGKDQASEPDLDAFFIADAYAPRAWIEDGRVMAVFRRFGREICPFWRDQIPQQGQLCFAAGSEPVVDLSAALGLGPVLDVALLCGERQFLLALRELPLGTELIALEFVGKQWTLLKKETLGGDFRTVRADLRHDIAHLILAEKKDPADTAAMSSGKNWALHYLAWSLAKRVGP